jgi:hypothetical protein
MIDINLSNEQDNKLKNRTMKKISFLLIFLSGWFILSCSKDDDVSERFAMLTTPIWVSESLLVNGEDAGGPGQMLEDFNGEVVFNEDGTGQFGEYSGTWSFASDETQLVINTPSFPIPITANIEELTASTLEISTFLLEQDIRMSFRAR